MLAKIDCAKRLATARRFRILDTNPFTMNNTDLFITPEEAARRRPPETIDFAAAIRVDPNARPLVARRNPHWNPSQPGSHEREYDSPIEEKRALGLMLDRWLH